MIHFPESFHGQFKHFHVKNSNSFVNFDFTYCFTFSDGPENTRMEGEERGGRSRGSASGNRNGDGGGGATVPEGGGEWSCC